MIGPRGGAMQTVRRARRARREQRAARGEIGFRAGLCVDIASQVDIKHRMLFFCANPIPCDATTDFAPPTQRMLDAETRGNRRDGSDVTCVQTSPRQVGCGTLCRPGAV
jgi:hypothetical protein